MRRRRAAAALALPGRAAPRRDWPNARARNVRRFGGQ
ncbi:hypothetical protein BPC006_II0057 [Burkholderia pseudomallei BPC006]|nr:hypothetical protein BPC006_II0057 [Burkholderia pseudomallei BPC006]